jgi:hypothetical protein
MVPIDVPIAKDIKQEMMNNPGNKIIVGTNNRAQFTVASRAPMSMVSE